jgi:hypothetical protein
MIDAGDAIPTSVPIFLCEICDEGIRGASDMVLWGKLVTHPECMPGPREAYEPLTSHESSRLIRRCWDHPVAVCGGCRSEYRITEMGADLISGQHYLCPVCRMDLTWAMRHHIAVCPTIRQRDPQWQAAVRAALAHTRELRKRSQHLTNTAGLTRIESEVVRRKSPGPASRPIIKRSGPPGQ